jgi:hypothetical protein
VVEGTIVVVRMCSAYLIADGYKKAFHELLSLQTYDPAKASNARYAFTFDIFGKAFARILVDAELEGVDLADLYGNPWFKYRRVGFRSLWISHPDWSHLTKKEMNQLRTAVTNDLRHDYAEDELSFWFDDNLDKSYLLVTLEDVEELEDIHEPPHTRR